MKNLALLCFIAIISCSTGTNEEVANRDFMIQYMELWINSDTLYYSEPNHTFLEKKIKDRLQKGVVEEYESAQSILKGEAPVHQISLNSDEIGKLSERANFEKIDYWRKDLFTDSSQLKLKNRAVTIRQMPRGWAFTKPTFIRNNKYCFFGYDKGGTGGYFVYEKDGEGRWRKVIKVTSWTVDFR